MKQPHDQIVMYRSKHKDILLDVRIEKDTVWLTQAQISELFARERTVITKHIQNIFQEGELTEKSNVQNLHIANSDKPVKSYSLDVVISVGYRVKSVEGTHFRQWATKTLKEHILKGFTINHHRIQLNYLEFQQAVADVKSLLPAGTVVDNNSVLELISLFADTWLSLDAYDKDKLTTQGSTKKKIEITTAKLQKALTELKKVLISKNEATELFGVERTQGNIAGIVGNIMQSFDKQYLYPSAEEKAAHLLYFMIKNHPCIDGNKRCGAYAFIWFLRQAKILDTSRITAPALTALTLLIAESDPKDKEKMVGLVCSLLVKRKR
jgi:prophage maintenance system killer protein